MVEDNVKIIDRDNIGYGFLCVGQLSVGQMNEKWKDLQACDLSTDWSYEFLFFLKRLSMRPHAFHQIK